ncbi:MAG: hypothetical protein ACRDTV_17895 [Mycobacterium sp.]
MWWYGRARQAAHSCQYGGQCRGLNIIVGDELENGSSVGRRGPQKRPDEHHGDVRGRSYWPCLAADLGNGAHETTA